jgi:hypothetical protein
LNQVLRGSYGDLLGNIAQFKLQVDDGRLLNPQGDTLTNESLEAG